MAAYDLIVIGGGLVGGAIAWGAARRGAHVALLDEGDDALRAARGTFGLVWVQTKGAGMPPYAHWTRRSAELWPELHEPIYQQSERHPGAFAATCHSGVTLAGAHALALAPAILAGALPPSLTTL